MQPFDAIAHYATLITSAVDNTNSGEIRGRYNREGFNRGGWGGDQT